MEWYHDFIDRDYKSGEDEIIALYYFDKADEVSVDDTIGRLASESSIGTWTTLETLDDRIFGMRGRAFSNTDDLVKISYPLILWEMNNVPQLMSGIAGNIFGMKAVKSLRLVDATLPLDYVKSFKGPNMGTEAIQKIFKRKEGPLLACVPKPKIGMTVEQHCQVAWDAWSGGVDLIKDDENLTSQSFNKFQARVEEMAKTRDKAEKETGDIKDALINVTAETKEMEKRTKLIHDHGFRYFMIDVVTTGFSAVQTLREVAGDLDMAMHAHRAMHATFTKHYTHGISMYFLAKLMRLIGLDNLHIGTVVGKLDSPKQDVIDMKNLLLDQEITESEGRKLKQSWGSIKGTLPVASGGLHPGVLPEVMTVYNTTDMILQVGGGIHGHPDGTHAGAKASVQALEAWKEDISLEDKAKSAPELAKALGKWGYIRPI
ncbi:type III ribulose-bisphosphate carboxylase [Candidatus Heimdallarchaeota archaeon B3_Heim]|nr:MAG: type III ribulose-bisphosphate carboxylase [Candidatus Heimdallarchaeota archaeon B3_Heim]